MGSHATPQTSQQTKYFPQNSLLFGERELVNINRIANNHPRVETSFSRGERILPPLLKKTKKIRRMSEFLVFAE